MVQLPPLLCRPRPWPDESLLSYCLRLQRANGYERLIWLTTWLRLPEKTRSRKRFRPTSANEVDFWERLALVTGVPVMALYQMTLHRYLPIFTSPDREEPTTQLSSGEAVRLCQFPQTMSRWARLESATAFCPHCLTEAPYHRLPWLLHSVFACLKHGCWLLDVCQSCGEQTTVASVVDAACEKCGAALTAMPTLALDSHLAQTQRHLTTIIEYTRLPATSLPPLPIRAFMRLLEGLCSVTRQLGWTWQGCYTPDHVPQQPFPTGVLSNLSVIHYGILLTSAWHGVDNWPQGFYAFLDFYRRRVGVASGGIRRQLGNLYAIWFEKNWRHPDLAPIQDCFNDYVSTHFLPSNQLLRLDRFRRYPDLQARMKLVDPKNAAQRLGISVPTIRRMVRDGYVRAYYPEQGVSHTRYFVYLEDLEAGLHQRSVLMPVHQAGREMGTSGAIIQACIDAGLMNQTGTRLVRGQPQPSLTRQDVQVFLRQLAQRVTFGVDRPADALTLKGVCIRHNKIGMTAVQVLQRVRDGKLPAFHGHPELQSLTELWFSPDDVAPLTEQIKHENDWLTLRETARLLHVTCRTVYRWVQLEVLAPAAIFSQSVYFDRAAMVAFQQRLMTSQKVAVWLETPATDLSSWIQAGYLPVLKGSHGGQGHGYFFDRDTIAEWHSKFITSGELRRKLGPEQFRRFRLLVKRGMLVPVTPPHMNRFYHRADLDRFQADLVQKL